ncbi:hypothetical protein PF049_03780 [Erythrobacteraceae bacterium WH01K]|nr:hypothetical protein PF049_03780 [Erythrobacteraceae bacterium WH01K]
MNTTIVLARLATTPAALLAKSKSTRPYLRLIADADCIENFPAPSARP